MEFSPLQMTFVSDVTIPDGMTLPQNETKTKTWRVSTTTGWSADAVFLVRTGDSVETASRIPVPAAAKDSLVDISVPIEVPEGPGNDVHRVTFRVVDKDSKPIQYSTCESLTLWAEFRVHPFAALTDGPEKVQESRLPLEFALANLTSTDPDIKLEAVIFVRKALSKDDAESVVDKVLAAPCALQHLVDLMGEKEGPKVQFEALWAVTNIGSTSHTEVLVSNGTPKSNSVDAVPSMIRCLGMPEACVREQAMWALGNIAGHSTHLRDRLLAAPGCMASVAVGATSPNLSMRRTAVWALSNFLRGKPLPAFEQIQAALPVLDTIMSSETDDEVIRDTLWALSYVTDGSNTRITNALSRFSRCNLAAKLVKFVTSERSYSLKIPALRSIGNICSGTSDDTQKVVDAGFLSIVGTLLAKGTKANIKKEALWTLSNIAAGTKEQAKAIIDYGIVPFVLCLIQTGSSKQQKEAVWVVSNLTSTCPELCTVEMAMALCKFMTPCTLLPNLTSRILVVAMEGVTNLLRAKPEIAFSISDTLLDVVVPSDSGSHGSLLADAKAGLQKALNDARSIAGTEAPQAGKDQKIAALRTTCLSELDAEMAAYSQQVTPSDTNNAKNTFLELSRAFHGNIKTHTETATTETEIAAAAGDVSIDSAMAQVGRILGAYAEKQTQKQAQGQEQLQKCQSDLEEALAANVQAEEAARKAQENNARLAANVSQLEAKVSKLEKEKAEVQAKLSMFYKSMSDMFEQP